MNYTSQIEHLTAAIHTKLLSELMISVICYPQFENQYIRLLNLPFKLP